MCADNSLLLFEYPDISIYFNICKLFILEVLQCSWHLVLALMVKQHVKSTSVVVDLKLSSHWFFDTTQYTATENDIVDRISVIFANIVWSWLSICHHFNGYWCKNLCLASFSTLILVIESHGIGSLLLLIPSRLLRWCSISLLSSSCTSTIRIAGWLSIESSSVRIIDILVVILRHEKASRLILVVVHLE